MAFRGLTPAPARGETCRRPPTHPSQKGLFIVAVIFRLSGVIVSRGKLHIAYQFVITVDRAKLQQYRQWIQQLLLEWSKPRGDQAEEQIQHMVRSGMAVASYGDGDRGGNGLS
jgi:hypothetical protein